MFATELLRRQSKVPHMRVEAISEQSHATLRMTWIGGLDRDPMSRGIEHPVMEQLVGCSKSVYGAAPGQQQPDIVKDGQKIAL
jgi:hypothetical protein